jgi:hypothetical protein
MKWRCRFRKAGTKPTSQYQSGLGECFGDYASTEKGIARVDQMNDQFNSAHSSHLLRTAKISRGFWSKEKPRDQDEQQAMHHDSVECIQHAHNLMQRDPRATATQRAQFCPSKKTPQTSATSSVSTTHTLSF